MVGADATLSIDTDNIPTVTSGTDNAIVFEDGANLKLGNNNISAKGNSYMDNSGNIVLGAGSTVGDKNLPNGGIVSMDETTGAVDVSVPASSVTLNKTTLSLYAGDSETLTAAVEPSDATDTVNWTSSDPSVATVDENGVVTALKPGTATITATADGVTAECVITVSAPVSIPDTYPIEVVVSGGGEAKTNLTNASRGSVITVTATPDDGYELAYITVDGERISGTTFTMPEHAVTVRVYFTAGKLPFADVASDAWYFGAVKYAYDNGLMDGVSATEFDPDGGMTRGMVWAILARMDGETVTGANWLDTARAWAVESGVSDGTDPNGLVTREQLATMLWRYVGEPASAYSLSAYADADAVSDWAGTAMRWAVENGVISGVTANTLVPQGTATRAQCAAMLMRFAEL